MIQESDVKDVLRRMKGGKTMSPDGIPIEVWRSLGDLAIVWLTKLFMKTKLDMGGVHYERFK
jgi:hypothetical protein